MTITKLDTHTPAKYTQEELDEFWLAIDPERKFNIEQVKQFLYLCKERNLDPRLKQIYAIPRWNSKANRNEMTIVTSIDGFRLIAERTGCYAPGSPTQWLRNDKGLLLGATVFVKKMTRDGTWHEVSETAFLAEYMPKGYNKMWQEMTSVMISKVAEARALRRAFPETISGLYTDDEMAQAQPVATESEQSIKQVDALISQQQVATIMSFVGDDKDLLAQICQHCCITDVAKMRLSQYDAAGDFARKVRAHKQAKKQS